MNKTVITVLLLACLAGCASAPSTSPLRYYLLDGTPDAIDVTGDDREQSRRVSVAAVTVAPYLSQPNFVMKASDHQITVANFHRWAEPLPAALTRTIMRDLRMNDFQVSPVGRCTECDTVTIGIEHFYPRYDGDAVLSGQYQITRVDGSVSNHPFQFTADLKDDGYEAAVATMRGLVQVLSLEIAASL